ncbi:MAG: 3D domain-containing protein [Armatimonadota bacterium]
MLALSCIISVLMILCTGPIALSSTARKITVAVDGGQWEYVSSASTVGGALKDAGVTLEAKDRVTPAAKTKLKSGMNIRVVRITEKVVTATEPIKYTTVTRFNFGSAGRTVDQKGENGEKVIKYLVTYKDGVKIGSKVLGANVTKKPVNEVVSVSRGTYLASRDGSYRRCLTMSASAYDPGPRSCGKYADGYTANGMRATKGVVAVDPRVIPLGTKLYVEGYGYCIAADTGGAIKGLRIDLCYDTYREAIRFGRKKVQVYILD